MSKNHKKKHTPQHLQVKEYRGAAIDLVVTTSGRFDMLEKCLDSIYQEAQLIPLNLLIIDNGSDPTERQQHSHLFQYHPEKDPMKGVVIFKQDRTSNLLGFPAAANRGAGMGVAPLIMFISDDVVLQPGAVEKVVSTFNEQSVGIVGIKLLFPPNSTDPYRPAGKVQHIGMALNIRADPVHPLVGWSNDNPRVKKVGVRDVFAVTGACYTIRRELFKRAGMFDLAFGRGTFEDTDLCLKVRGLGFRIIVNTDAVAYHYVGASAEKRKEPYPIQQNNLIFKSRWANTPLFFWDEHTLW